MKQVTFGFPNNQAQAFATFSFSKEWRIILSFTKSDFFGEGTIIAIVAMTEAQAAEMLQSEWKKYVQN